ncbi:MAG: transporter [Planctomycetaceae bacterium]
MTTRVLCLVAITLVIAGPLESVSWGQGTLFRWRSDSPAGGPDLDEPLVTDRPDFTEASVTVGKDVLQIEFGYTFAQNDDGGVREQAHSWGEPLFRYGLLQDWLEFRIAVFPETANTSALGFTDHTSGAEHIYLGFKLALTGQDGFLPETALVPQMTVPTDSGDSTNDRVLPGANLLYGWDINDCIATAGSTQFNLARDGGSGGEYVEFAQSWTIAYSLTDELGAYTEWFALIPAGDDTEHTQHYFDGGFTYLLTDDIQWDIRAGIGLNEAADDFFIGTGLSVRFK